MISRREFVAGIGALASFALVPRPWGVRALRIRTLVGDASPDFESGLRFGFAEADRTATLFGWTVQRAHETSSRGARGEGFHAIIGAEPTSAAPDVPYMSLVCSPVASGTFVLPRCDLPADEAAHGDTRVVTWHASLEKFGASQLNDRYHAATHTDMTGSAWLGWFAVKALAETAMRVGSDAEAMRTHLLDPRTQFDGHKGVPLHFDSSGRLQQPVYELRRAADGSWRVSRELT